MEAMILGYPPEEAGQITVTATKEEWNKVLKRIPWDASEETQELIEMLADLGVSYL